MCYERCKLELNVRINEYSKTCLKRPLKKKTKISFQDRLLQVKSIAECSKRAFCNTFRPLLSYHLSLGPLFCLLLSDGWLACGS